MQTHLICHITRVSMENNTRFFLRHVSGKLNTLADLLSRLKIEEFKRLAPQGKLMKNPEKLPADLWPIPDNWWVD